MMASACTHHDKAQAGTHARGRPTCRCGRLALAGAGLRGQQAQAGPRWRLLQLRDDLARHLPQEGPRCQALCGHPGMRHGDV